MLVKINMKKKIFLRLCLAFIFCCVLSVNFYGQTQSYKNYDSLIQIAEAKKDWHAAAILFKEIYVLEKNPSRLYVVAKFYARARDTQNVYSALDTALLCGYTNIYLIDKDTVLSFIRNQQQWKDLRVKFQEKYQEKEDVFYWGLYYGVLCIILILNLFLFFSTKERSYLFICLMLFADMHWEMMFNSSLKVYFVKIIPWMADAMVTRISSVWFISTLIASYFLFTKAFLKLKEKMPRFNIAVNVVLVAFLLMITASYFQLKFPDWIGVIVFVISIVISLSVGILAWRKGIHEAKYFMAASLVLIICFTVTVLITHLSAVFFVYSALNIGLLLFFTILTVGVGSKLKLMQKEKEQAQEKALEVLEEKVQQRTAEVVKQKHLVEEKQKEILESITYAKRLQQAILPPQEYINKFVPQHFILYKPKDIVAGDFYWSENVGDLFFIAAADSTGHGVPGAMVSVVCSNALNRTVLEFGVTEPGKILDKARELVIETFVKSSSEVKDGMDISLLCIDLKNKNIFWSGANNPLWYVQNNELKEIKADKQPIGKTENPKPFTTHQIDYKENTMFYLFTDGLADQFGGEKGKKFKYKPFADMLLNNSHLQQEQQAEIIDKVFSDWKGALEQVDDVCVIGVRV
ncbi:MAG: SpoIIE family protein phosphatase [Bacteroidetes bacterium]|nr:SpoIIE family protein phosphatase [Bacteroidota bacterium]